MQRTQVVLVDQADKVLGQCEKLKAHLEGHLHRAISVFLVNAKGEWLLQRRADHKYHSPGLWSNTCCSHPQPGEDTAEAAAARLMEEMGIHCALRKAFSFIYRAPFENGLTEHELDHVFIGFWDGEPNPNPEEVSDWRWVPGQRLAEELKHAPEQFTAWVKVCYERVVQTLDELPPDSAARRTC